MYATYQEYRIKKIKLKFFLKDIKALFLYKILSLPENNCKMQLKTIC